MLKFIRLGKKWFTLYRYHENIYFVSIWIVANYITLLSIDELFRAA
jgi:hypothetical protein